MTSEGPSQGLVRNNYDIVKNRLNGKTLLHAGFAYNIHRKNQNSSVWVCVNKRHGQCGGAVKLINESDNVQMIKKHKPECQPNLLKNDIKILTNDLKREVTTNFGSIQKMYETKIAKLQREKYSNEIPIYNNIKKAIYRSRYTALKVKKIRFKDPAEVTIPEFFHKHLLLDYNEDGNRIIVFASDIASDEIKNVHHFFCDGTFDCCPCPFKQIYTIHGDIGNNSDETNIVPIFYALLVNKEKETYEMMFKKINEALPDFKPLKFTLDFEMSAIVAINNEFPTAEIHGCFVHFQNAVYRRAKSLKLLEYEETTQYVKLCICLAYLPKEEIEDGWLAIMENSIPDDQITKLNDYFVEQWLEPADMVAKWCCYKEKHRTTNLVEAWNHRLKNHLGTNPSLLSFLEMVRIDISTYGTAQARPIDNEIQDEDEDFANLIIQSYSYPNLPTRSRSRRQVEPETTPAPEVPIVADNTTIDATNTSNTSLGPKVSPPPSGPIKLMGLRVEESDKEPKIVDELVTSVLRETHFYLRLFGENFTNDTIIAFTHTPAEYGNTCDHLLNEEYKVSYAESDSALFYMLAPPPLDDYRFYICAKNSPEEHFLHQGPEKWKVLATHNKLLPLWASIILIIVLLLLASLFSGLNLGLMALDRTELKIIANTGTEKERKYARAIMPVRAHGNYLLCTILLSNVAVNSTFTVILDDLTSGLVAVIGSTLAIVFIAEITPQAVCARHGLFVGAKSIWIMKIVMGICAPLAWPTSKLLDYFLGEEIGTHYNRERLKELVRVTDHVNDLDREEVNIISGALDLRKKKVSDVMTKLKDCFMLPINSILDFETMSEIVKSGYSRIPVYEGARGNIITVLFIKDLAFVDPDDNTPLRTLCQYYQNPCNFVFEDVTLDVMLKQFKEGHKGHMAFVQRIEEGDGDPVYETVGLVTLEDVIEEMIQAEIVDETDVFSDNRTKKRLTRPVNKFQDLAAFAGHHEHQRVHVSPQLVLATFQFLNTSVEPFRVEHISETVLRRLLKQDVIQHIKLRGDEDKNDPKRYVFSEGKPVDYFVLILEGRVEVTVGRENLVFEAGPFTYFGVQALTQNVGLAEAPAPSTLGSLQNLNMDSMLRHSFVPDYSVKAIAELYYLTIKRSMYLAAKRATLMEKGVLGRGGTNEQIEPEVDKLLREGENNRIEEEDRTHGDNAKVFVPTSASPHTNSTFKSDKEPSNPEEEKLLKK